jgi:hypothetical protein
MFPLASIIGSIMIHRQKDTTGLASQEGKHFVAALAHEREYFGYEDRFNGYIRKGSPPN